MKQARPVSALEVRLLLLLTVSTRDEDGVMGDMSKV